MGQGLSTTSYALLGLLVFEGHDATGMTGYEVKQRADRTLRFYWVAPAMSQVYIELARLADAGLVTASLVGPGGRRDRRYRISPAGLEELRTWQTSVGAGVPDPEAPGGAATADGRPVLARAVRDHAQDYLAP